MTPSPVPNAETREHPTVERARPVSTTTRKGWTPNTVEDAISTIAMWRSQTDVDNGRRKNDSEILSVLWK